MDVHARQSYLESQVLSAPPQKLRLLLIEAALLRAREAQAAARDQRTDDAWNAANRCQQILCELLAGIGRNQGEVAQRTYALYAYLLKEATLALKAADPAAWNTLIEVLTLERETWHMVCRKLAGDVFLSPQQRSENAQHIGATGRIAGSVSPSSTGTLDLLGSTVAWDA